MAVNDTTYCYEIVFSLGLPCMSAEAWAAWASAFGTISAVFAAIFMAFRESSRQRKSALQRAVITAAEHVVHLKELEVRLYTLCSELAWAKDKFKDAGPHLRMHLTELIKAPAIEISDDALLALVALPGNIGEKLARARADLRSGQRLYAESCFGDSDAVNKWINKVWISLCRAHALVKESTAVCESSISTHRVTISSFIDTGTRKFDGVK